MSLRHRLSAAVLAAVVCIPVIVGSAYAADPISFNVSIANSCLAGYGPHGAAGTASLLDASNAVLSKSAVTTDAGSGYWSTSTCFSELIVPGMKVKATFGAQTRTYTVPALSMRIDRATDVFSGKAPAGASLSLTVNALTGFTSGPGIAIAVTATGSGTWSKDTTSSVNAKGGDYASLSYTSGSGDNLYVSEYVPQVIVRLGTSEMSGNILTGGVINATLRTSGGTLRAKASIGGGYGYNVAGRWTSTTGVPIVAAAGNLVDSDAGSDGAFTLGNVTATVTTATDVVTGSCIAGKPYRIEIIHLSPYTYKMLTGTCSSGGTYNRDATSTVNIVSRDQVTVSSKTASGDLVQRRTLAP